MKKQAPLPLKSKVFFKKLKDGESDEGINNALDDIIVKSGLIDFVEKDDFTGIKIHFGERGNEAHIKASHIKSLLKRLKNRTSNLFLTDANVLYMSGVRWNSVGHLKIAHEHGFNIAELGIPVIIADGIMGRAYRNVPVDKKHFKNVKIASDYFDIDALICLSHVTGHMMTSFAGSMKNIGMGCAARAGKLEQHSNAGPEISTNECIACGLCVKSCPEKAMSIKNGKAFLDENLCTGCGECTIICRYNAIKINWGEKMENMQEKMVEYAYGLTKLFPNKVIYFNFLNYITKDCDCMEVPAKKISPDIGILASDDPLAIDKASLDLINENGMDDKFKKNYPNLSSSAQFRYAEKIGLGKLNYELIAL